MIFISVGWGIYGIGDAVSLSKIGKSVIGLFLRNDFLFCVLGLVAFPFFGLTISDGELGSSQLSEIISLIFECVPKNIVEPFSSGNTLQIIFLAVVVGLSLLFLGPKTSSVARAIEQINYILHYLMTCISKIVPAFIFVIIVSMFWNNTFGILLTSWKFFVVLLIGCLIICTVFLLTTSIRFKVSAGSLLRKIMPAVTLAALTASSAAAFDTCIKIGSRKLGINPSVTAFGIPLGMVMHNPIAAFNNLIVAFFFAAYYGIECSAIWLVTAVFCATVLAIASPPIPGGGIIVYTMLFLELGIPLEAIAVITAMEMFSDFIITASEVFCILPGMVHAADKVGMLKKELLRKA